jgi:hypothetical protein
MRTSRIVEVGDAYYHIMSRLVDRHSTRYSATTPPNMVNSRRPWFSMNRRLRRSAEDNRAYI